VTTARICLAGASGYLGARVAAAFRARAVPVSAILRSPGDGAAVSQLRSLGADVFFADAARHEDYGPALKDVGTAISCMASRNVHVDRASDFWAIDRDANIRFGLAAVAAHARCIILVATYEGVASRYCSALSEAKEQAVDVIAAACGIAGIPFVVIRPTAYFSDLTNRAFDSVAAHHRYTEIGDGTRRINPVDGDDVATFIVARAIAPGAARADYPVGGPDVFTFRQIGELAAEVLGTRAALQVRAIPPGVLRVAAGLAAAGGTCSARLRRTAAILRWMIYAGTHDAVAPSCGERHLRTNYEARARSVAASWAAF
jgi:uncharacterized protein YbjT (DUF2867 family)